MHILEKLRSKAMSIINELEKLKRDIIKQCPKIDYKSQDTRMVTLDSIQLDIATTIMWLNTLNALTDKCVTEEGEFDEQKYKTSIRTNLSKEQTEEIMIKRLRLSLAVLVVFKFDSMLFYLLRNLGEPNPPKAYSSKLNAILDATLKKELTCVEVEECLNELKVLSNIRNSLHNNGYHRNATLEGVTIDGKTFSFIKDTAVDCASLEHILIAISGSIKAFRKILLSGNLNCDEEIIDDFAKDI